MYTFRKAPTYPGLTPADAWQSMIDIAFNDRIADIPLPKAGPRGEGLKGEERAQFREDLREEMIDRWTEILPGGDQVTAGLLESSVAGTVIREVALPQRRPWRRGRESQAEFEARQAAAGPALSEDEYKSSAHFRHDIPWDRGMTEERAAALAAWYDVKKVREFYAQKRPISSFFGNLAGQALDPINYIPIVGQAVRAANIAKFGRIGGQALTSSIDAAANTAVFGALTRNARASYGDDVSFQATVSEIAMSALIGGAFGTVAGAVGTGIDARRSAAQRAELRDQLGTLRRTQEARVALNEAIGAVARGEDVRLSPTAVAGVEGAARRIETIEAASVAPIPEAAPAGRAAGARDIADAVESVMAKTAEAGEGVDIEALVKAELSARGFDRVEAPTTPEAGPGLDAELAAMAPEPDGPASWNLVGQWLARRRDDALAAEKAEASAWAKFREMQDRAPDAPETAAARAEHSRMRLERLEEEQRKGDRLHRQIFRALGAGNDTRYGHNVLLPDMIAREMSALSDASARAARPRRAVDTTAAPPEPAPAGRVEAEAAIAKVEATRDFAKQMRVDPDTGDFPESGELAQLVASGRLSADDLAELADADAVFENAKAYGEALRSLTTCLL